MKKMIFGAVAASVIAGVMSGCAYGGVAVVGDKAVVARNDAFLFGILRKVAVCKVTDTGLASCQDNEAP